jgi:hypothetical protein
LEERFLAEPQRKQREPSAGKAIATPEPTAEEAGAESDGSEAAKNTKRFQTLEFGDQLDSSSVDKTEKETDSL